MRMRSDAVANRERVLAAAEEVFGRAGHAGSTEEVARLAGVGIGTVFRHFPTKGDLIEATVVRHFELLAARARDRATGAPADALRDLIGVMVDTGATKVTLIDRLVAEGGYGTAAEAASATLRDLVDGLLRRAQETGAVRRDVTVDEVYLLVRGLSHAIASRPTDPSTVARARDVVWDGLAAR
jgi:AcrR family transcriptional regulator